MAFITDFLVCCFEVQRSIYWSIFNIFFVTLRKEMEYNGYLI